jgi:hypothetical protein
VNTGRAVPLLLNSSTDEDLAASSRQTWAVATIALVLIVFFAEPLYDLSRFSFHSELFAHLVLVPAISLCLVWIKRGELARTSAPVRHFALLPRAVGLVVLLAYSLAARSGLLTTKTDSLTWTTFLRDFAGPALSPALFTTQVRTDNQARNNCGG